MKKRVLTLGVAISLVLPAMASHSAAAIYKFKVTQPSDSHVTFTPEADDLGRTGPFIYSSGHAAMWYPFLVASNSGSATTMYCKAWLKGKASVSGRIDHMRTTLWWYDAASSTDTTKLHLEHGQSKNTASRMRSYPLSIWTGHKLAWVRWGVSCRHKAYPF